MGRTATGSHQSQKMSVQTPSILPQSSTHSSFYLASDDLPRPRPAMAVGSGIISSTDRTFTSQPPKGIPQGQTGKSDTSAKTRPGAQDEKNEKRTSLSQFKTRRCVKLKKHSFQPPRKPENVAKSTELKPPASIKQAKPEAVRGHLIEIVEDEAARRQRLTKRTLQKSMMIFPLDNFENMRDETPLPNTEELL